jgi:hypothetical protein
LNTFFCRVCGGVGVSFEESTSSTKIKQKNLKKSFSYILQRRGCADERMAKPGE